MCSGHSPPQEPLVVVAPSNPVSDMTLNDLLPFLLPFSFQRALAFFPPQSPQDYIRDSVLFTKPTGSVKKARQATYIRPNSQPSGPEGGPRHGSIMFMSTLVA